MGRFFQTTPTQFTEDFIYQPPWELIQQAAAKKQQVYDNALATSKLFNNIPIQHLQGVDDVANVKEKQRYYAESADNIAKAIQNDPANAQHYMANLEALGKELSMDMKEGDLSKIQSSAIGFKTWQDDEGNKEMKKTDPARYAAAEKTFLSRYINAGGNSISQGFKGEQITKDVDWKEILANADKIKASEYDITQDSASGLNIYTSKKSGKQVKKEDIERDIIGRLITDPSNLAALRQSQDFGMAKYFDDETGALDYSASGFNGIRGIAEANAYSTQTSSNSISGNTGAIAAMNEAGEDRRFNQNLNWQKTKFSIEEENKRVVEQNKSKNDKINAYELKIAEAQIAGDNIAVALWENKLNNLEGNSGVFLSRAGSIYKDTKSLQQASAGGDTRAQKIISEGLNELLKGTSIDFKDPIQKAAAEKLVGLYKQGKLNKNNLGEEIAKIIPVKTKQPTEKEIEKLARQKAGFSTAVTPFRVIGNTASTMFGDVIPGMFWQGTAADLKKKIDAGDKSPKIREAYNNAVKQEKAQRSEGLSTLNNISSRDWKDFKAEAKRDLIEESKKYRDDNTLFRKNFQSKMETVLTNFNTNWDNSKSKFDTAYETAPLSIKSQSSINSLTRDPSISKELFIENNGTNEVLSESKIKIVNYTGVIGADGRGRNGIIGLDKNGKQYKITANTNTPVYKAIMNIAKDDVNPNTEVGVQVRYPTVTSLKQSFEGLKRLGQSSARFDIKVGSSNYTVIGDSEDIIHAIDSFGNYVFNKNADGTPKTMNYIEAGVALENLNK